MEVLELTQPQFEQFSDEEQQMRLHWNLQYLVENHQRVEAQLTVARNYENMIPPFDDAVHLNQMVRKHFKIHVNSEIPVENPNVVRHFTWAGLKMLCADTKQLLKQFLAFKKPKYAIIALMNATKELDDEQERIINKYSK